MSARPTVASRFSAVAGFSLIWMSILLTVGAIIMVSALPGNEAGDYNAKSLADGKKLQRVEEAMRSFMATNLRRPCPADGSAENTANFGKEAGTPGTCTGNSSPTPNAPMGPDSGTGYIVSGTIPTRSLDLDDSFAFDSYGRRFTYVVDIRATKQASCVSLEGISLNNTTPTGTGDLIIQDIAGNTLDNTMYAYIQHGPSGYGAFPEQGAATPTGRVNSKSTNKWMQINAGVDVAASPPGASTFTTNGTNFTNVRYRNSRTFPTTTGGNLDTGFDDFLYYRNDIKNICCLGSACIPLGFRIDGPAANANILGASFNFNNPSIGDIAIYESWGSTGGNVARVLFGHTGSWPTTIDLSSYSLTGSNGFTIKTSQQIGPLKLVDLDGDGNNDLLFQSTCGGVECLLTAIFGQGSGGTYWPLYNANFSCCPVSANLDGTHAVQLWNNEGVGYSGIAAVAKFTNDTASGIWWNNDNTVSGQSFEFIRGGTQLRQSGVGQITTSSLTNGTKAIRFSGLNDSWLSWCFTRAEPIFRPRLFTAAPDQAEAGGDLIM
jgi:hypothetical protein